MKQKYPKPKGKIEYGRLKKKVDLVKLCADFYLLYTMKTTAEREAEAGRAFLKWHRKLLKDICEFSEELTEELERLFLAYFPFAVASELQNGDEIKTSEKKVEKVVGDFLEKIPESEDELLKFLEKNVADCGSAISFFGKAKEVFGKLKWEDGFGGKKWVQIADTAHLRLSGEIDAVTFIDNAFNIEHHSGHMFDKHENIRCDGRKLNAILNIKRDSSLERMKKLTKKYASSSVEHLFNRGAKFNWWKEEENGEGEGGN